MRRLAESRRAPAELHLGAVGSDRDGGLHVLPGAILRVVIAPMGTRSEPVTSADPVFGVVVLGALDRASCRDGVAGLVRSRHCLSLSLAGTPLVSATSRAARSDKSAPASLLGDRCLRAPASSAGVKLIDQRARQCPASGRIDARQQTFFTLLLLVCRDVVAPDVAGCRRRLLWLTAGKGVISLTAR